MNTKVTRSEEWTEYCHVVTHDFGDRFSLNVICRPESPSLCTLEFIDQDEGGVYGESFCVLRDIPCHMAESFARALLDTILG